MWYVVQIVGRNYDPDPAGTRARFRAILDRLLPKLSGDEASDGEASDDGGELIRNPVRHYESGNLELVGGGIGEFTVDGGVDVIRCMNVFMYFDHPFREKALSWATTMLRPGGLLLCGNWIDSAEERARCSSILASQLDDEGFVGEAVDVLRRSGRHAWRNHVGHVAMRPVTPPPLAPSSVL
nr:hypothetical protein [uncultured bacterium]